MQIILQAHFKFYKIPWAQRMLFALLVVGLYAFSIPGYSQDGHLITGKVVDEQGSGLPGVSVIIKGTQIGTQTDGDGNYSITVSDEKAILTFSFIGFTPQEVTAGKQTTINISLLPDVQSLKEVVVVGYGVQRKESVVSAVETINPSKLRSATGNLTNSLAGRIAGVIAWQSSGEPGLGTDNSQFYIRGLSTFGTGKKDPLILIDNMESTATDLARLQTDDIASFSVLKDASAAAVYGSRGANGVILVTTKLGAGGAAKYSFRVENTISGNTRNYKMTDNISYMRDANEATLTRNPATALPYGENKINHTIAGDNPALYPNNNWLNKMVKDYTVNQRYNLNISGGDEHASYYIAGTYNVDNGILKVDPINDFNSNIKLRNYSIRSNVTVNLSKTTQFILRLYGQFDDYRGPIGTDKVGGGAIAFQNALSANPVMFPAVYDKSNLPYVKHPLFGSVPTQGFGSLTSGLFMNPYAEMVKGYQVYKTSNIEPQIQINQDLGGIVKGLSATAMTYLQRYSYSSVARAYNPFFYTANVDPTNPKEYTLSVLNNGALGSSYQPTGTEYLGYSEYPKVVTAKMYLQGSLNYARQFGDNHEVSGLLTSFVSSFEAANAGSVTASLPQRNTVAAGRFTYGYNKRYLAEFNFGYNGSERFYKTNRFGFFPSMGIAYNVSNEAFFSPLLKTITNLKLRATYGLVGNDQIGNTNDRFLYLSDVNPNNLDYSASFGTAIGTSQYTRPGYSINRYGNKNIKWEISKQINLGLDLTLFDSFTIIANAFKTYRSNIFFTNPNVESAQGLSTAPSANYGKGETQGIDLSMNYNKQISSDFSFTLSGTFTYSTSKIKKSDQIQYTSELSHLSNRGYSFNQAWGYIAERLFIDDQEVKNSPDQSYFGSTVRGGDIKYRDINHDGIINGDDRVAIGYPTQPEIIYGIGPSMTYKRFDFGFMFQGAARSTFFIDPLKTSPFIQFGGFDWNNNKNLLIGTGYQNGELQAIHQDHWSEENPDPYAFWPRLSTNIEWNNMQQSTWWMRNGSFIRLKTVTLGYTLPTLSKTFPVKPRAYFSANNLFAISNFKLWDVEMGGNGLGYPVQAVYMVGLQLNF
ncbi:MAG TPA: TonB-dependent receptor [Cyclobacteriaceae bacterium]|nr:TonB-dependent receptor [Cyclobacteriaceae bacterium]